MEAKQMIYLAWVFVGLVVIFGLIPLLGSLFDVANTGDYTSHTKIGWVIIGVLSFAAAFVLAMGYLADYYGGMV